MEDQEKREDRRFDAIAVTCERESNDTICKIHIPDHPALPAAERKSLWLDFRKFVDQRMAAGGEVVGHIVVDRFEEEAAAWDVRTGMRTEAYAHRD